MGSVGPRTVLPRESWVDDRSGPIGMEVEVDVRLVADATAWRVSVRASCSARGRLDTKDHL